ncbi:MAG: NADH-quinone oxidoreductase subunit J [Cyanobacteria bacterium M5B4]|nr:MAG: NADH-quinone oxidoreductase subunit J [Cyanobacteria bacterium M5B4]
MNLSQGVELVSLVVLTTTLIAAAMGVVLIPSIVYSAFLLGLVFLSMAGLYLLLNADFVAAAQVLIYVGAVNVLILFAIMLVNRRKAYREVKLGLLRTIVTAVVCLALFGLLLFTNLNTIWLLTPRVVALPSTIVALGQHFFSDYLLPFELASVLLLVALIGAIILARREFVPDRKQESLELLERPKEQLVSAGEE